MAQLLLVEDDVLLGEGVKSALEQDGHAVALVHSAAQAQKLWQAVRFDLCLLDIRLPDGSGLDLCAGFRQTRDTPIIFLTANDADEDVVRGFRMGGDDYVTKPFAPEVLRQRVLAVLRRTRGTAQIVRDQELEIDLERQTVRRQGEPIRLTATEWKLLERLVRSRGRVLTRTMLLEQIWDVEGSFVDENTLSVHIRRLRQKLEPDPHNPRYIVTVFDLGYTFGEML
ncbi:response regulator transcription factor [uncultured Pseudoflavonifractor sp.]|uniref:response regulator transcription factor n=1 Tax=uncultured Pseudoflavonifractor sp. TaxID=1221379 RepID=UPI0025D31F0B|nr:response regulator transcription factor [uncultured Pseudoflavonifractor sp.]